MPIPADHPPLPRLEESNMSVNPSARWMACFVFLTLHALCAPALAGGGAQDVAVVVNQDSWASKAVANHYVRLRNIPANNVIRLTNVPSPDQIGVDAFRDRILSPVLQAIRERGLARHINTIAYSVDFPWGINVRSDFAGQKLPKPLTPVASINGLTYLYSEVLAPGHRGYLRLNANRYVRTVEAPSLPPLSRDVASLLQEAGPQLRAKRWETAEQKLRSANAIQPRHAVVEYHLAGCLALQGREEEAMEWLAQAVNHGWSRRKALEQAPELAPLRQRADFKKIVSSLPETAKCEPSISFDQNVYWSAQRKPMLPPRVALPPLESSEHAALLRQRASRYMLSTVLGVTSGRGNSVAEVLACLDRSVAADHSRPSGVVYFPTNSNIRSKTREPFYASAAAELEQLGVAAEISSGVLPQDKPKVAGAMIGTATFNWEKSGSRILPGAICEHLTSLGGVMRENGGQTPLTEFIRHGAAGSSGTVTEPYAIQAKFPLPFLHVHYARGCSLAESFYQSVAGPYQLLIVGDPLCQPWSKPPRFELEGLPERPIKRGETLRIKLKLAEDSVPIVGIKSFIDGRLVGAALQRDSMNISTAGLPGGAHELRVVGFGQARPRPQGAVVIPFEIASDHACELQLDRPVANLGETIRATIQTDGKIIRAELRRQGVGVAAAPTWELSTNELGLGASTLRALVLHRDGSVVSTAPVKVNVERPASIPPLADVPAKLQPGIAVRWSDGGVDHVSSTAARDWLRKLNRPADSSFRVTGYYEAEEPGLYQLQIRSNSPLTVRINDQVVLELSAESLQRWHYAPAPLAAGQYQFEVRGKTNANPQLAVRFGLRGAASVNERFRHRP